MSKILILLTSIILMFTIPSCESVNNILSTNRKSEYTVGIVQYSNSYSEQAIIHAMMEDLQKSFEEENNLNITFDIQKANGDKVALEQICDNFANSSVDVIVTSNLSSSIAMKNKTSTIPIVFTNVEEPVLNGIVSSLDETGTNITGVKQDFTQEDVFLTTTAIDPSIKTFALPYNINDEYAIKKVPFVEKGMLELNYNCIRIPFENTEELSEALNNNINKVDAIYVSKDPLVQQNIPTITTIAYDNKVPVFATENGSNYKGILATISPDFALIGTQTASQLMKILEGEDPSTLPVVADNENSVKINVELAKYLNLNVNTFTLN